MKIKVQKKATAVILSFVLMTTMKGFNASLIKHDQGFDDEINKVVRTLPSKFELNEKLDYKLLKKDKERPFSRTKSLKYKVRKNY